MARVFERIGGPQVLGGGGMGGQVHQTPLPTLYSGVYTQEKTELMIHDGKCAWEKESRMTIVRLRTIRAGPTGTK